MEKITKKTVQRMTQQLHEKNMERMRRKLLLNNNSEILNDFMIRCRQYDISILEKNINNLSLKIDVVYNSKPLLPSSSPPPLPPTPRCAASPRCR
jgi:hypothetical protein